LVLQHWPREGHNLIAYEPRLRLNREVSVMSTYRAWRPDRYVPSTRGVRGRFQSRDQEGGRRRPPSPYSDRCAFRCHTSTCSGSNRNPRDGCGNAVGTTVWPAGWERQHPDLGFNSRAEFKLERDGEAALFEVKAFISMRTWEDGFDAMERNAGQVTAFYVKGAGRVLRKQAQRARDKFAEHRPLGLPGVTVLANPGKADVSLDIESLLTSLYGDLVVDIETGQTHLRLHPSLWTDHDVTSAFLILDEARASLVVHTPAAIEGRCP
jgi:hypothetical protein